MGADTPPRNKGEKQARFLRDARTAAIRTDAEKLHALHRMKEALGDVDRDGGNPSAGDPRAFDWVNDLAFDTARTGLDNYNALLGIGEKYGARLADAVRDALRVRRTGAPVSAGDVLTVTGHKNQPSDPAPYNVVNRLGRAARIEFLVGEFRNVVDGRVIQLPHTLSADPPVTGGTDERLLAAGTSRVFVMRLDFTHAPPGRYASVLAVRSNGRPMQEIPVRAVVS